MVLLGSVVVMQWIALADESSDANALMRLFLNGPFVSTH